ncbi:MAG: MarR family transcriptional regulator [Clostridiales bacterium]|nr:MarR family transcriptional regulator [Candidatus Crickella caballi]
MDRFEAFAGLIIELNRCILRIKDNEMKQYGLKASHTMCIYQLSQHEEGLTATQLTDLSCVDKAAISRTLKHLVERKLIHCDIPENKRSYRTLYYLTDEGKRLSDSLNKRINEALESGGQGVTDEDRETMYKCMGMIRDNLSKYVEEM